MNAMTRPASGPDSTPAAGLRSIPALLARNAAQMGGRPAYREKEFGIWQSWTWAEAQAEIAGYVAAQGNRPGGLLGRIIGGSPPPVADPYPPEREHGHRNNAVNR